MGQGEGQDWWYSVHGGGCVGSGCAFDDGDDNGGSIGWYCIVTDDGGRNYARVSVCVCRVTRGKTMVLITGLIKEIL